jgi:hypothetical protein
MKSFLFAFALCLISPPLHAQENVPQKLEIESIWPGIHIQINYVQRIPPDRLLVGVALVATADAPAKGTLIGTPQPIPANANPYDVAAGFYRSLPFSMTSSVMTDDISLTTYSPLDPIAAPGKRYRPAILLETLLPGQSARITLQFPIPPRPPPPAPGQPPVQQTISFLFTNAKAPIKNIPIPPPN